MKKLLALLLCLCMMLSAVAFAEEAPTEAEMAEAAAAEEVTDEAAEEATGINYDTLDPATVVATLNGEEITWGDCQYIYDSMYASYSAYGDSYVATMSIYQTMTEMVLADKAEELGYATISSSDMAALYAEADADLQSAYENYVQYSGAITEESTDEEIAAAYAEAAAYYESLGYTQESLRDDYVKYSILNAVYNDITKDAVVTDEDVLAYYNEQVENDKALYSTPAAYEEANMMNQLYAMFGYDVGTLWYRPDGYRVVHHILLSVDEEIMNKYNELAATFEEQSEAAEGEELVADETAEAAEEAAAEPVTAEQVAEARAAVIASVQSTIDEINAKLAEGADFDALIAEYSTDPGAASDYDICAESMSYVTEFVQAGMAIAEVGGISEPTVSSYGVHILKYVKDLPGGGIELTDELKASLSEELLSTRKSELYSTQMSAWMEEYEIKFIDLEK